MAIVHAVRKFVSSRLSALSLALLSVFVAVQSYATDPPQTNFDFTAAETAATEMGSALATFLTTKVVPAVLVVVAAMAALLLVYRVVRWLMKALSGR